MTSNNVHKPTVDGFGDEWERFDQAALPEEERERLFESYFSVFPWGGLAEKAEGFDLGCGSGRWAKLVATRVYRLHCIDPSSAIEIAKKNLSTFENCVFHQSTVDSIPLEDGSMDFGYSLGVLHHIPDTQSGIEACVSKLKPGAPLLLYLYYAFDNKPRWYRAIWKASEYCRRIVSILPYGLRYVVSQLIAGLVYFPAGRLARLFERFGVNVSNFPLSFYRNCSFYTMRTDALDRFGTRLEKRFTKPQILQMMEACGLERVEFSDQAPYWCAVGYRRSV